MSLLDGRPRTISSSAVEDRIDELENDDTCPECGGRLSDGQICTATAGTEIRYSELYDPASASIAVWQTAVTGGERHQPALGDDEESELYELTSVRDEGRQIFEDWGYDITLTMDDDLDGDWARGRAEELGYIGQGNFNILADFVDWEEVSDYFKQDEPYITVNGIDYYYI